MLKTNFNLSLLSLSNSEIANLKGFEPEFHNDLISMGLRQETVTSRQLEFVNGMGILCVLLSRISTKDQIDQDWQFTQHSILYIENKKSRFKVYNRDKSEKKLNYIEFCFAIAMMACRQNMVEALRSGKNDLFKFTYFYFNYLKACLNKIPLSVANKKNINFFIEFNKSSEYELIENNIRKIIETI